jgi:hypothetical protein
MKRNLLLSFVLLAACSCTTTMNIQHAGSNAPQAKIQTGRIICLLPVDDGAYAGKVYTGSGLYVFNSFSVNLFPFTSKLITADAASRSGAAYTVKPVITHWEPRNASWSGKPTRVEMTVSVYDTEQNKEIINTNLSIRGRSFTFTDQSAEALASFLIKKFIQDIAN